MVKDLLKKCYTGSTQINFQINYRNYVCIESSPMGHGGAGQEDDGSRDDDDDATSAGEMVASWRGTSQGG